MSTIEVGDVSSADLEQFVTTSLRFWAEPYPSTDPAAVGSVLDRAYLARADGEAAGTSGVIDFELTLPGGGRIAMDGVTWVVVGSVFRRRGVLRALMARMLEAAQQRGVPVLGLGASESGIYRRFGYGVASHVAITEIDTAHAALRSRHADTGRLRLVPTQEALPLLMDVERRASARVGAIVRSEASWRRVLARADEAIGDIGPLQIVAHHNADGIVDGFATYRIEFRWPGEIADGLVHVRDLWGIDRDAHLALWQHVLDLDLVEHVRMERGWLDEPLRHLLADSRRLRQQPRDDLHIRVADVAAALTARRYAREDGLVVEVRDPSCPDIEGRYRVEGGLDGASAARTDKAADLVLDGPSLGSILLGDVTVAALRAAGLVDELTTGAAARASAMFGWSPRPWLTYMF